MTGLSIFATATTTLHALRDCWRSSGADRAAQSGAQCHRHARLRHSPPHGRGIGPYLEDRTPMRFAALVERAFSGFRAPPGYGAE